MTSTHVIHRGGLCVALAALALVSWPPLAWVRQPTLHNRPVDLKLKAKDGTLRPLEVDSVALSLIKVKVREGDRIESLLKRQGIVPDAEALTAVYAANPKLTAKSIKPGVELMLPAVTGKGDAKVLLGKGSLVELTLNPGKKKEFQRMAEKSPALAANFAALDMAVFAATDSQEDVTQMVKRGADLLHGFRTVIQNRTAPLPPGTADALHGEARIFNDLVGRTLKPGAKLAPADVTRLRLLVQDLEVRAESLKTKKGPGESPPRYPDIMVTVRALSAKNGNPVKGLFVYYAPLLLKDDPAYALTFDQVTSPSSRLLGVANYYIWAGPPGPPVPPPAGKVVQVRRHEGISEVVVDLVIP